MINKQNIFAQCDEMFRLWLERIPEASWGKLIEALEKIEMGELAKDLTERLLKGKLYTKA